MNHKYLKNKHINNILTEYSKKSIINNITIFLNSILGIPRKRSLIWLNIKNLLIKRS